MAEIEQYEDDIEQATPDSGGEVDIKSLREAAKKGKKAEQELAQMRRELAFSKAGISTDDPKMAYFYRGYDGELTVEAIRSAASEAGFITVSAEETAAAAQKQESLSAQQRTMAASAGATYLDDSHEAVAARMNEALEQGGLEGLSQIAEEYGITFNTPSL